MSSSRPELMILLGSGFSQGLGLPGTNDITKLLRDEQMLFRVQVNNIDHAFPRLLWKMIAGYYDRPNFETMLHAAKGLNATYNAQGGFIENDFSKPVYGAFMDVSTRWRSLASNAPFDRFAVEAPGIIGNYLAGHSALIQAADIAKARAFLSALLDRFDLWIVTLNYDDIVERALDHVVDGFDDDELASFSPKLLMGKSEAPKLLHLHGSLRFVSATVGMTARICRAANIEEARNAGGWKAASYRLTQGGDQIFVGPIISGLRKPDKAVVPPFGYYQARFIDLASICSRFLLIGFGGNDLYVNQWITEALRLDATSRLAMITKFDRESSDMSFLQPISEAIGFMFVPQAPTIFQQLSAMSGTNDWIGTSRVRINVDGFPTSVDPVIRFLSGEDSAFVTLDTNRPVDPSVA